MNKKTAPATHATNLESCKHTCGQSHCWKLVPPEYTKNLLGGMSHLGVHFNQKGREGVGVQKGLARENFRLMSEFKTSSPQCSYDPMSEAGVGGWSSGKAFQCRKSPSSGRSGKRTLAIKNLPLFGRLHC